MPDGPEKKIEDKVVAYAKKRGFLVYKFTSPNRASVPDRLFVTQKGTVFFCEFKRTGARPTPKQEREHKRLRDQNVQVFVVDSVEMGKFMIDLMTGA